MKKIFMQGIILSYVLLFAVSCRKQSISPIGENSTTGSTLKTESSGGCRVTSYDYYDPLADFHSIDYFSYKNGIVDEVLAGYGQTYKMVYDKQGKLIKSRVYDGATLLYIISFDYKNNKVIQENWRDAVTNDIFDVVYLTYNKKGELTRNQSIIMDFYVDYRYYPNGSLESWEYFSGGSPLQKAEYIYDDKYKNPLATLTGIDYMFWYGNSGFGLGTGKKWYSGEKISIYDTGGWFIYYELNPKKTIWDGGAQNYPLQADYTDISTHAHFLNTFEYENCNPPHSSKTVYFNKKTLNKSATAKRIKQYFMPPGNGK